MEMVFEYIGMLTVATLIIFGLITAYLIISDFLRDLTLPRIKTPSSDMSARELKKLRNNIDMRLAKIGE